MKKMDGTPASFDMANPFKDLQKLLEQYAGSGSDLLKSPLGSQNADIEKLLAANRLAFDDVQKMVSEQAQAFTQLVAQKQAAMFTQAVQNIQSAVHSADPQGDPKRSGAVNATEQTKAALDQALSEMKELVETTRQAQVKAFSVLTDLTSQHVSQIQGLMRPK